MERFAHKLFKYNQPKCGTHILTMCTRPATGERSILRVSGSAYHSDSVTMMMMMMMMMRTMTRTRMMMMMMMETGRTCAIVPSR